LKDDDTIFRKNDYSWNQKASVFYLESPAGVGFSVCGEDAGCKFDDNNSAD
jgi:carboxypeptidase C (cathepsin A)